MWSRGGAKKKVVNWVELQTVSHYEEDVELRGFGQVRYDPRIGKWVPAELVDPSRYTLQGHIDINTNLGALPGVWAIVKVGTGDVTGGSGVPIHFTCPANADQAILTYTHGSAIVSGKVKIIADVDFTEAPSGGSNNYAGWQIRHGNQRALYAAVSGYTPGAPIAKQGYWSYTNSDGFHVHITGRKVFALDCPVTSPTQRSSVHVLDRDPPIVTTATNSDVTNSVKVWAASPGVNFVWLVTINTNGAPTPTIADLYNLAIYTGA